VYRILGPGGRLLYVGKSIRVRTRLLSYFRAGKGEKAADIVEEAADIRWEYIPDEFGALLQEMRLIQRHRPRFNVQHKRKRAFAFVKVTSEAAPRVLPVTRVAPDGATYFGPFPRVAHVARTIRDLAHVLELRDCASAVPMHFADQLDLFGGTRGMERPARCIRAELGSCTAPCAGLVTEADYAARVQVARDFLAGVSWRPIQLLNEAMMAAARRLDFEYAAIQRDRMERMRRFQEDLAAYRGEVEGLRFIYPVDGHDGARRLYLVRGGQVADIVDLPAGWRGRPTRELRRRIEGVFRHRGVGPAGLSPEQAAEILLVARWFRIKPEERERAIRPERWLGGGEAESASSPVTALPTRTGAWPAGRARLTAKALPTVSPDTFSDPLPPFEAPSRTPSASPAEPRAGSC
jgi:excinuclease ABC subunit C